MASKKIQIVIGAKDKTRAAFAKVAKAMNVLRKSVFNLKTGIGALVGVGGFVALARAGPQVDRQYRQALKNSGPYNGATRYAPAHG